MNTVHITDSADIGPADRVGAITDAPIKRRVTADPADKAKVLGRLRRLEGQVRGVARMVEEDQYCVDILTQLSAIIAGARAAGLIVLEDHIRDCVLGTCRHGHQDREEILDELTEAIERFTRSAG